MLLTVRLLFLMVVVKKCEFLPTNDVMTSAQVSLSYHHTLHTDDDEIAQFVLPRCQQRMEPGLCRAYLQRWHYDAAKATCRQFVYGGCGANLNNFPTEAHCRAACPDEIHCPTDKAKTCYVSESVCVLETSPCRLHPNSICRVVPCSCQVEFTDELGNRLACEDTTTPESTHTTTITITTTTATTTDKPDSGDYSDNLLWYLIPLAVIFLAVCMVALGCYLLYAKGRRNSKATVSLARNNHSSDELVQDSTLCKNE